MIAGFDQTPIEIQKPYYLAGFTRATKTDVVSEPLFITSCAFQTQQKKFILCVIDCVMVDKQFTQQLKKDIYINFGIEKDDIVIAATHTHSAPAFIKMNLPFPEYDDSFADYIQTLCMQSIENALLVMEHVTISVSINTISNIYGNRNIKDNASDTMLYTYKFTNNDVLKGIFMNISCHPTILNQSVNEISSDLIGGLRRMLVSQYQVPVCISNGACGDTSTRFYRQESGNDEVSRCSQEIINQMCQPFIPCSLDIKNKHHVSLQSYMNVETDYYACKNIEELQQKENLDEYDEFMLNNYLHRLSIKEFYHELDAYIYDLTSMYIVTIPGELVSTLGLRIKKCFPQDTIIVVAYANDYVCYLVDKDNYGKYFESKLSQTPIGIADLLCERIVTSIQKIKEDNNR